MIKSLATAILVFAAALAPTKAFAETPARETAQVPEAGDSVATLPLSDENIFQKYYRDMYAPFVNPLTLSIFAGGTVSTITLAATGKNFEDHVLENASTHRPLGDTSKFGDIMGQMVPNIAYTAWFAGRYLFTKDPLSEYRAEMMFRATLAATTMSTILKAVVREPRPGRDTELTSFPSGHSTSIFTFATVVASMHGPYWGAGAYGLATFVAFSRMNDDRHRLHDVVAGATLGSIYGLAVYQRMRNAIVPSLKTAKFQYEVMPVVTDDGAMLGLSATF